MKVEVEPNGFVRDNFRCLHNKFLRKNHTVHAYGEPNGGGYAKDSDLWFTSMRNMKDLIEMPFKDYIHPEADYFEGYYDHCSIEKGTFDYDNMKRGEVFPAILYFHHETILTVACVVRTSEYPDIVTGEEQLALYIYYPSEDSLEEFKKHKEVQK